MQRLAIAVLLLVSTACIAPTARVHPQWRERVANAEGVVVVPPGITVLMTDRGGLKDYTLEELTEKRAKLVEEASDALRRSGFRTSTPDPSNPLIESVNQDHNGAIDGLFFEPRTTKGPKGSDGAYEYSMRRSYETLAHGLEGDLVLCFQIFEKRRSTGTLVKESVGLGIAQGLFGSLAAYPEPDFGSSRIKLSVVDRATGDLLWSDVQHNSNRPTTLVRRFLRHR